MCFRSNANAAGIIMSCRVTQDGHLEYGQLIEFVRPSQSFVQRQKKLPSSLVSSCTSGDEARSFYEELCAQVSDVKDQSQITGRRKRKHQPGQNRKQEKIVDQERSDLNDTEMSTSQMDAYLHQSGADCSRKIRRHHNENKISTESVSAGTSVNSVNAQTEDWTKNKRQLSSKRLTDHRQSELFRMAQNGDNEGVLALMQQGVNVNSTDIFGWTASMSAAFEGHVTVLQTLVKGGADLDIENSQGQTALSLAHEKHHAAVAHFIESFQRVGLAACQPKKKAKQRDVSSFYCDVCKSEFTDSDKKTHERSTVHIFNTGQKPIDDSFSIPSCNIGYRLMLKSGWSGDKGLGPGGRGKKFPVKTVLKRDRKGLGTKVTEKAKVTHFRPGDNSSIASAPSEGKRRAVNAKTLSKRAQRAKEKKDRQWEIKMRYQLS